VFPEERSPVVHAYILIQTKAEDVTGPYDVIVRAEADTVDELGRLVVARVQSVDGITRTLTCPVVNL
jgi:DNA-binding Lrp family transcriptional regulator